MITCRHLFRVDRAWKYTNTYVLSAPVQCLQECHRLNCEWKIGGTKDTRNVMDLKRKKTVTPIWRPVCTQSSSSQELVQVGFEDLHDGDGGGKLEDGIQVHEVNYNISSSSLDAQHTREDCEAANEPAHTSLGSGQFQGNDQGGAPEAGSMPFAENHSISVKVGASLMRFIKGKGGSTQKNIEEEIGVKIIFPSSKEEDFITIEGSSTGSVTRASERIQLIIDKAVKSPNLDYSHFISLPLAIHPELVDKLLNFKRSILGATNANENENLDSDSNENTSEKEEKDQKVDGGSDVAVKLNVENDNEPVKVHITNISYETRTSKPPEFGIEKSIFINPKTFHLTVLMLKLWNNDRVDAGAEVLQSVSAKVLEALSRKPVSVRLKGIECMRGSLSKARVLYVPVEEIDGKGKLLLACQAIIDAFVQAGLVEKDAQRKSKLHATVMNTRHRKRGKLYSFDARGIFNQFGSQEWGEYLISEAHLSQRFAYDESGYYRCCASIQFPVPMQLD